MHRTQAAGLGPNCPAGEGNCRCGSLRGVPARPNGPCATAYLGRHSTFRRTAVYLGALITCCLTTLSQGKWALNRSQAGRVTYE